MLKKRYEKLILICLLAASLFTTSFGMLLLVSVLLVVAVSLPEQQPYLATVCEKVDAEKKICVSTKKVTVPPELNPREVLPTLKSTEIELASKDGTKFKVHIWPGAALDTRSRQVAINSYKASFPKAMHGSTPSGLTAVYTVHGQHWRGYAFEGSEPVDALIFCWDLQAGFGCRAELVVDVFENTDAGHTTLANSARVEITFPLIRLDRWPEVKELTRQAVIELLLKAPAEVSQ